MSEDFNTPREVKEIFRNISPGFQNYLIIAQRFSKSQKHFFVGLEHVLAAFLSENKSLLRKLLSEEKVNWKKKVQELLLKAYNPQKKQQLWEGFLVTPRLQKIWHEAVQRTRFKDVADAGEAHVLFAMLQDEEGFPVKWLRSEVYNVEELIRKVLQQIDPKAPSAEEESPAPPPAAQEKKKAIKIEEPKPKKLVEVEAPHVDVMPKSRLTTLETIFKTPDEMRAAREETIILRAKDAQELLAARKAEKEEMIQIGSRKYQLKHLRERKVTENVLEKLRSMARSFGKIPGTLMIGNKEFSFDELLELELEEEEFLEILTIAEETLASPPFDDPHAGKGRAQGDSLSAKLGAGRKAGQVERPADIIMGASREQEDQEQITMDYKTRELAPEMMRAMTDVEFGEGRGPRDQGKGRIRIPDGPPSYEPAPQAPASFGTAGVEPWNAGPAGRSQQSETGYDPYGLLQQNIPGEASKQSPPAASASGGYDPYGLLQQQNIPGEAPKQKPTAAPASGGYDPYGLLQQQNIPGEAPKQKPPAASASGGYDPYGLLHQNIPGGTQQPAQPRQDDKQGYGRTEPPSPHEPHGTAWKQPPGSPSPQGQAPPASQSSRAYDPFGLLQQGSQPESMKPAPPRVQQGKPADPYGVMQAEQAKAAERLPQYKTQYLVPEDPFGLLQQQPEKAPQGPAQPDPFGIVKPEAGQPLDPFGILKPEAGQPPDPFGILKPEAKPPIEPFSQTPQSSLFPVEHGGLIDAGGAPLFPDAGNENALPLFSAEEPGGFAAAEISPLPPVSPALQRPREAAPQKPPMQESMEFHKQIPAVPARKDTLTPQLPPLKPVYPEVALLPFEEETSDPVWMIGITKRLTLLDLKSRIGLDNKGVSPATSTAVNEGRNTVEMSAQVVPPSMPAEQAKVPPVTPPGEGLPDFLSPSSGPLKPQPPVTPPHHPAKPAAAVMPAQLGPAGPGQQPVVRAPQQSAQPAGTGLPPVAGSTAQFPRPVGPGLPPIPGAPAGLNVPLASSAPGQPPGPVAHGAPPVPGAPPAPAGPLSDMDKLLDEVLINIYKKGIPDPYPGELWDPYEAENLARSILAAPGIVAIISRSPLKTKKLIKYFAKEALGPAGVSSSRRYTGLFVLNVEKLKAVSFEKVTNVLKVIKDNLSGRRGSLLMCFDVDFLIQHVGLRKMFEEFLIYMQGSGVRCLCSMKPQEYQKVAQEQQQGKTLFLPFMLKETTVNEARLFVKQSGPAIEKELQIKIDPQLLENAAELAYKFLTNHTFPDTIIEVLRKASHFKKEEFGDMGLDEFESIDKKDFLYILSDYSKKG